MNFQVYRKVLLLVSELHLRGYQRLRIAPGMAPSGMHWRCAITPVSNISSKHGAKLVDGEWLTMHYSSSQESRYFDREEMPDITPSQLANLFVKRFPEIVAAGEGSDWLYAGWYVEMLHLTYPNSFPIAVADWDLPEGYLSSAGEARDLRIPLPPPGEAPVR